MTYKIVDPASLAAGRGPRPAASPFDRRVSEALGVSAFEAYLVEELPPEGETGCHDHLDDGPEDLYFIVSGDGWGIVDDEQLPLRPGSSSPDRSNPQGSSGLAHLRQVRCEILVHGMQLGCVHGGLEHLAEVIARA